MATYKLTIEYDGTRFRGWQAQKPQANSKREGLVHRSTDESRDDGGQAAVRTIQGELLDAARRFLDPTADLQGSGRTDAGVHALAQVAHLTTAKNLSGAEIQYGLNDNVPFDINVVRVETAAKNFHARRDAIGRSYVYQIAKRRTAFGKRFVWWIKDPLDAVIMGNACSLFEGMHDFSSFCDIDDEKTSTKVLVEEVALREFPEMIVIRVRASHFLWKMVRRIVGTTVETGRHTVTIDTVKKYLTGTTQTPAQWTAPPSGLFLEQVKYKGDAWRDKLEPIIPIPSMREL